MTVLGAALGVGLAAIASGLGRLLPPASRMHRLLPWLELVGGTLAAAGTIGELATPPTRPGLLVALGAIGLAGGGLLRDWVVGIPLRAAGALRVGQVARTSEREGEVLALGPLRVWIQTADGRCGIPYRRLSGQPLTRISDRQARHTFTLTWTGTLAVDQVQLVVRQTALLDPSAAAGRPPQMQPDGARTLRVTVVALEPALALALEERIRAAVESAQRATTQGPTTAGYQHRPTTIGKSTINGGSEYD